MEKKLKPTGNKITLQLDELFKNSVSPETIAKEVQKAAAEYYAETAAKEAKRREKEERLDSAREDIAVSVISWYETVKDIEFSDEEFEDLLESIIKNIKETEDILSIRRNSVIKEPDFFSDLYRMLMR